MARIKMAFAVVALSVGLCNAGQCAAKYSYTPIVVPGAVSTFPVALNDAGTIAGQWTDAHQGVHGYVFSAGAVTSLDFPGAIATTPAGINNQGEVVGSYLDSKSRSHGFIYEHGRFHSVDFMPGQGDVHLTAVNDSGIATGIYESRKSYRYEAFTFESGAFNFLPFRKDTYPMAINNAGEIIGTLHPLKHDYIYTQGFTYAAHKFKVISAPSYGLGLSVYPSALNDSGIFVGSLVTEPYSQGGFVYSNNAYTSVACEAKERARGWPWAVMFYYPVGINNAGVIISDDGTEGFVGTTTRCFGAIRVPGAAHTNPKAINDAGQITGQFSSVPYDAHYYTQTFIATPLPQEQAPD